MVSPSVVEDSRRGFHCVTYTPTTFQKGELHAYLNGSKGVGCSFVAVLWRVGIREEAGESACVYRQEMGSFASLTRREER